jgi:hypothetical protein
MSRRTHACSRPIDIRRGAKPCWWVGFEAPLMIGVRWGAWDSLSTLPGRQGDWRVAEAWALHQITRAACVGDAGKARALGGAIDCVKRKTTRRRRQPAI